MIKTFTAWTAELDDVKLAVRQIKSRLNLENGLLKNTIGIIACHYEFIHSGILKGLCAELPFDVVGTVSTAQSAGNQAGSLLLTLMVLTSDDIEFVKVLTSSLETEPGKAIADAYKGAVCGREKPGLILTFAPYIVQNTGDEYVNALTDVSQGVPCFGTFAIDETTDFSSCFMLCNGDHYLDKMAMVLFFGNVHPKFFIANISESRILAKSAIVTKSAGPVLMEVNERPVIEYLEDLGLVEASETQYAMSTLPFMLDYNDGTPKVSKIIVMMTPEKYVICAGAMPQGSTLYMAKTDREDVLYTTSEAVDKLLGSCVGASALLVYSCISRAMSFGTDHFKEMVVLEQKVGSKIPFMMVCSGGEICPTQVSDKKAINRFHNNAFIACLI